MINNLFKRFEALWPKILPPDLKMFVHFFFAHPLYLLNTIEGIKSNLTITHQGQDKKEIKHTQLMFYQLIGFYNYVQSS